MVRTQADGVRIWFWTRQDPSVPFEVKTFYDKGPGQPISTIFPDPSWGPPEAMFPVGNTCEYDTHFDPHQLVFDLTFCVRFSVLIDVAMLRLTLAGVTQGDWAGTAYPNSGCGGSCKDCKMVSILVRA